jgi:PAS domain S-box-containing protein
MKARMADALTTPPPLAQPRPSILLVDDHPANLLSLRAVLDGLGPELVEARSGEEALQRLRERPFAVVLLDVVMGGLDGFETARLIRDLPTGRSTPIIFLTAYEAGRAELERGYALGAVDFLTKPVVPNVVRAKVAALAQLYEEKVRAGRQAEQYRLLVEGTKDYAIFMLDTQGRIATWNAGAERLKGYSAEEIIGKHFSTFYPPEAVERGWPEEELRRAVADGRIEDEGWRVKKDGSRFWANVVITALRDETGTLRGFGKVTRDMTERRQAEENAQRLAREEAARQAAEAGAEEARRERERLRATLASIGDAVIATDADGRVTFLNPVAEGLTGWAQPEAAGLPLERVFPIINEESRRPVENPVAKALRQKSVVALANHTALVTRMGAEVPIEDSAAPIRAEDGSVAGVVMVFRDVTEARRAAEARRLLAAIVESSDDAIVGESLEGIILSWNRAAERLYGYTADEVVGKPLTVLVPPEKLGELAAITERLRRGEGVDHFETVWVCKDGGRVDVSLTISPIKDAEGKVVGASKVARDITAVKRREAELRFLAGASDALAELLDVPSTLQTVAGLAVPHFADWCAVDLATPAGGLERVAVAHPDPLKVELARQLHSRHPPDPGAAGGVWTVLRGGAAELVPDITDEMLVGWAKDADHIRALRELGPRSYLAVPLAARGKTLGVVTFVMAESGRRFAPDDLRLAEDLARRAAVAVENARLYADLREADRRKDEFLALLGHELRNPLAPISYALEILDRKGDDPATVGRARAMIGRQANQLTRLVGELLDASRIARGKVQLALEPLDLAALVRAAVEDHRPEAEAAGLAVEVAAPPEPVWVRGDRVRLTQVVTNLWSNGVKFTPRGGRLAIRLGAEEVPSAKPEGFGEAVLAVSDTGVGIDPANLPTLFQAFRQVDADPARTKGGLGLGLAVVRGLVELHGGRVEATSAGPGQGATFTVRLPLGAAEPGSASPSAVPPPFGGRVVIVEDSADAAESLREVLELMGFEVAVARTGPEGVELCRRLRPDGVVCDIGLPGMTGFDVARALRADPATAGVRLVAVSGYAQEEDRRRAAEAGFDVLLAKPADADVLAQLLARARD